MKFYSLNKNWGVFGVENSEFGSCATNSNSPNATQTLKNKGITGCRKVARLFVTKQKTSPTPLFPMENKWR